MSLTPLNEDLDIIQNLVIPSMEDDLDIIQKLDDEPNDVGGLSAAELKFEFDRAGNIIKKYINEIFVPALSDTVAEAEERAKAEAERIANEEGRGAAEQARVEAEQARLAVEASRVLSEEERKTAETARKEAEAARVREEQARVDRDTGIVAQATEQANLAAASAEAAAQLVTDAQTEVQNAKQEVINAQNEVQNAKDEVANAQREVQNAQGKVEDAEAWAKGTRNGEAVPETDPAYQNNSKYWAENAAKIVGPTVTPEELTEAINGVNQSVDQKTGAISETVSALSNRVQPINLGGTNATTADAGRKNLGAAAVKALTQAEYDALPAIDPNTVYIITDANADGVKIETGSYVGTGTFGASNRNRLTFSFVPKVVFILPTNRPSNQGAYSGTFLYGRSKARIEQHYVEEQTNDYTAYYNTVNMNIAGKTLTWYSTKTANRQLNFSDSTLGTVTYTYLAIG